MPRELAGVAPDLVVAVHPHARRARAPGCASTPRIASWPTIPVAHWITRYVIVPPFERSVGRTVGSRATIEPELAEASRGAASPRPATAQRCERSSPTWHDLVIRNGTVVDGTGAPGVVRRRRDHRRRHHRGGRGRRARRARDRRRRRDRHPRLRRHPHALRRPGHLGPDRRAVVAARRHHHRDGQLRRRLRAGARPIATTGSSACSRASRTSRAPRSPRGSRGSGSRSPSTSTRSTRCRTPSTWARTSPMPRCART